MDGQQVYCPLCGSPLTQEELSQKAKEFANALRPFLEETVEAAATRVIESLRIKSVTVREEGDTTYHQVNIGLKSD